MTEDIPSYRKVQYDLRPAKQIERRMLIDAFHILATCGFPIREYQYTGMGSIYFVDFIMFHKLVGITRLLSVEGNLSITKRVEFNRPFADIRTWMSMIGDVIPQLSSDIQHILWLDYDSRLNRGIIADILLAGETLSRGSILLATVDVKPPTDSGGPAAWRDFYAAEAEKYFSAGWTEEHFTQERLAYTNAQILFNAIRSGLAYRDVSFIPLFSFKYADGHPMLTVGGMFGTADDRRRIESGDFSRSSYLRTDTSLEPYAIEVPKLTRRERLLLDQSMPCPAGWLPSEFEITQEEIAAYREVFRYFPAFAELLV